MGKNRFKDESYNPKYGIGGRVTKDDFSIDGKSWDYRDPENLSKASGQSRGDRGFVSGRDDVNPNSYDYTNKLYDYSYGAVRDASAAVNVTNVNSKGDVKQLLDYLQNGPKEETPEAPEMPKVDEQQSDAAVEPYTPSAELTKAREKVQAWESGAQNPGGSYGARESSSTDAYKSAVSQVKSGGVSTNVDEFASKVDKRDNQEGAQRFADDFLTNVKEAVPMVRQF